LGLGIHLCEYSVLQAVLHFIYRDNLVSDDELSASSSHCSVFDTLAGKLMAAADKYELPRLRLLCESYLCKHISVNSVSATLALAERHHATELKSVCLKFAAENLSGNNHESLFYLHGFRCHNSCKKVCLWVF
jgi:speckle-type POZ protein